MFGSLATAIAASELRMPRPSEVPRSGSSRWMADSTARRSSVGTWVENPASLNATIPIRTDGGCRATKARAAALAASRRVGSTSVAAMLPETSKARTTVPSSRGTPMTLSGRASETTRIVTPAIMQRAGMRRVHRARRASRPAPARAPDAAALAPVPHPNCAARSCASPLARPIRPHAKRDRQQEQQHRRPDEGHGYAFVRRRRAASRTIAPIRSSSVDSATASTPARRKAARRSASRRSPASR